MDTNVMERTAARCLLVACTLCVLATNVGCKPRVPENVDSVDFMAVGNWRPADIFDAPPVIELAAAIQKGDLAEIDRLLDMGVDINIRGKDDVTPLGWAYMVKNKPAFRRLLERGADPNRLMCKVYPIVELVSGYETDSEWLELALKHGGNPNIVNGIERKIEALGFYLNGKETPIFETIVRRNKRNFDLLVKAGANLNYQNVAGRTPLTHGAVQRSLEYVYYLLELGADHKIKDGLNQDLAFYMVTEDPEPNSDAWQWREKIIQHLEAKGVDFNSESQKVRDSKEPRHNGAYEAWEQRMKWLAEKKQ